MATDDLNRLVNWADALLAGMTQAARRQLMGEMARNLRASQSKRIRANIQPDGSAMTPRKPLKTLAKKRGATRRKMFQHLISPRWLKATSTEHQAVVEFVGSANRLATIHQYGLKDRIKGREIRYPARELLGITSEEVELLEDLLLARLTS
ncbi:phage virion morphogenesis protein [Aeromonas sp. FDAARGOS 1419]|uniref:phage virion morphogenesis protein n=1 Tax=Aeromonas sp. FDAARGOS 1419 TaxID=2778068 RepID=UPI001C24C42C|nr:phage virion morphogenesis protein [Aeromonas sp. FDAARGOS 1419]QWZ78800.1 phage virion morphogenesis protein [Aeromonas sp. FDAARGOS 1419]